jgi:uncharacterized repeat protein (TIGR01451 family)
MKFTTKITALIVPLGCAALVTISILNAQTVAPGVLVPRLKVQQSGPKEKILMRNAEYEILVTNTGETPLSNVIVSNVAPAENSIVAAPGGIISGNTATWTIKTLSPGA